MSKAFEVIRPTSPSTTTTLIELILDETGSMTSVRQATIGGVNEYLNSQRGQEGQCLVSLTKFDKRSDSYGYGRNLGAHAIQPTVVRAGVIPGYNPVRQMPVHATGLMEQQDVRTIYQDVNVEQVQPLNEDTYQPQGMTNLFDAVGARIHALTARAAQYPDASKLVVIMTDGEDNCSKEYTAESLKALIEDRKAQGWTFVSLAANQDAWSVGQTFGMAKGNTFTYDANNVGGALETLSAATTTYRAARSMGAMASNCASDSFFSDIKKESK